jgi:hypothetical protein
MSVHYLLFSVTKTVKNHLARSSQVKSSQVIKSNVVSLKKVPKREIFVTELFTLSDSIWIGDLRTEPKNPFVAPSSNLGSAPQ